MIKSKIQVKTLYILEIGIDWTELFLKNYRSIHFGKTPGPVHTMASAQKQCKWVALISFTWPYYEQDQMFINSQPHLLLTSYLEELKLFLEQITSALLNQGRISIQLQALQASPGHNQNQTTWSHQRPASSYCNELPNFFPVYKRNAKKVKKMGCFTAHNPTT